MATYDKLRAFEQVPSIMGLDLTRKRNDLWWGAYYINGQPHSYRKDKMKVTLFNGDIWVHEEGGITQSIATWLITNGRATDYREAYRILDCKGKPIDVTRIFTNKPKVVSYVPRSVVDAMAQIDLNKCPLFRWMCTLFPEERVREVWRKYNVTTDSQHNAVFWYADSEGRIAFDKRVKYKGDGHRDKSFGGTREYRSADGFTSRPYFGAHLVKEGEEVNIVESEKTALACASYLGGTWLACGGKNNLKDVANAKLYPDKDAYEEWSHKGECVPWFEGWHECGDTSDIGDLIEWEIKHNQK
jgi:hypothetical protein